MNKKLRFFSVMFFFVSTLSLAHNITFTGRVVDNSLSARNLCQHYAVDLGVAKTCRSETGTVIISSIRNITVKYKGKSTVARIVTMNYK